MKRFFQTCLSAFVFLLAGLVPGTPARAADPTLVKVIEVVAVALGEPALKDAVPLIECIVNKGPLACVDVKGVAETEGKKAAKQYIPDDPKIKAAVEIIKAAFAKDYLRVLEVGGVKLLPPLACGLVFQVPGPLKELVCNKAVFDKVSGLSGPVFKQLILTVKSPSLGNIWALVTVMDADLACSVIKTTVGDFPGLDEVCGPFGEVIDFAKDVGEQAAKAGKKAGKFLLDTGEGIVNGAGDALESACKGIGLCDSDGKKLMSANEYYKYRLFPWIHDRVVLRLVNGQQNLGHDDGSMKACLNYYLYDLYKGFAPSLAPKIKTACENLGARLHKDADALAQAFAAAPAPYFEKAVKSLVPIFAVEGYGQNKSTGYRKFIEMTCLPNMRGTFPIPEPINQGTTGWDHTCKKVGGLFTVAYKAEEQKLTGAMQNLVAAGCFPPAGWVSSQGLKLECDSYSGYKSCLEALSPGLEKKHCSVNPQKADAKLAKSIVDQLGKKRCRAEGVNVICTRPWKVDKCGSLLAYLTGVAAAGSKVQCKGDAIAVVGFLVLSKQAADIVLTLNGGSKQGGGLETFILPSAQACKTIWDPLAITCKAQETLAAHPEINLPSCPSDPNQDGADQPCYAGPYSMKMAKEVAEKAGVQQGALILPGKAAADTESKPDGARKRQAFPAPELIGKPPVDTPVRSTGFVSLPDLAFAPQVTIGNRAVNWGGTLSLTGNEVMAVRGGGCEAAVQATLVNLGIGASGPFDSSWKIGGRQAATKSSAGIAPGTSDTLQGMLRLRPGINVVEIQIDTRRQVQESNEENNQARFVLHLTGQCQGMAPIPGLRAMPSPPATAPTRIQHAPPAGTLLPLTPSISPPGAAAPAPTAGRMGPTIPAVPAMAIPPAPPAGAPRPLTPFVHPDASVPRTAPGR